MLVQPCQPIPPRPSCFFPPLKRGQRKGGWVRQLQRGTKSGSQSTEARPLAFGSSMYLWKRLRAKVILSPTFIVAPAISRTELLWSSSEHWHEGRPAGFPECWSISCTPGRGQVLHTSSPGVLAGGFLFESVQLLTLQVRFLRSTVQLEGHR